jgi:hypothetical protein
VNNFNRNALKGYQASNLSEMDDNLVHMYCVRLAVWLIIKMRNLYSFVVQNTYPKDDGPESLR